VGGGGNFAALGRKKIGPLRFRYRQVSPYLQHHGKLDELRPELPVEKFAIRDLARSYEYTAVDLTA